MGNAFYSPVVAFASRALPPLRQRFASARSLALLGLIGGLALVFAGARLGAPRAGVMDPTSWLGLLARRSPGPLTDAGLRLLLTAAFLVLCLAWWGLLRLARSGRLTWAQGLRGAGMLWLPFALGPPLFSRDVYAYVAQGRLASHGFDPSRFGPQTLGGSPFLSPVDTIWRTTHAPYGPVAAWAERLVVQCSFGSPALAVVWFRVLAVGCTALTVWAACLLVHRARRSWVLVLAAGNPITLLHLVSGAHNDAWLAALLVGGLLAVRRGFRGFGIALVCFAGCVKAPAFLGLAILILDGYRIALPERRAWRATTDLATAGAAFGLATWVNGFGLSWLEALDTPARVYNLASPTSLIARILADGFALVGVRGSWPTLLPSLRLTGFILLALIGAGLLLFARPPRDLRVIGLGLLATAVLGPVFHPWYVWWSLPLLAAGVAAGVLAPAWHRFLIAGSVLAATTELPNSSARFSLLAVCALAMLAVGWLRGPAGQRWLAQAQGPDALFVVTPPADVTPSDPSQPERASPGLTPAARTDVSCRPAAFRVGGAAVALSPPRPGAFRQLSS